ncbi:unnamed protein product, partial [marine sediment metagenome]
MRFNPKALENLGNSLGLDEQGALDWIDGDIVTV